jgi:hypothetical protein
MADADETDEEPGGLRRAYRTVTPGYLPRPDAGMDAVGWGLLVGIVLLLVPLLPFLVVVWLLSRLIELVGARGDED